MIGRIVTGGLSVVGAAVLSIAAYQAVTAPGSSASPGTFTPTTLQPQSAATGPTVTTATSPPHMVRGVQANDPIKSHIRARIVTAGFSTLASWTGAPALPSGARFQLTLTPSRAGIVDVYTINPNGERSASPVWTGRVDAGVATLTPHLRLEGNRGMETLEVALRATRDARGNLIYGGAHSNVSLWHY